MYGAKALIVSSTTGFLVGATLIGVMIWMLMPSMMILTKESNLGFDETVAALEKSIEDSGSVVSRVVDMNNKQLISR